MKKKNPEAFFFFKYVQNIEKQHHMKNMCNSFYWNGHYYKLNIGRNFLKHIAQGQPMCMALPPH